MLFEEVGGQAIPLPPFTPDGVPRVADGVTLLNLEQAAARFGKSPGALREIFAATWADYLPKESDPVTTESSPACPGMPSLGVLGDADPRERLRLQMLHRVIYPQLSDELFAFFLEACRARRLNPWCRHLFPRPRWDAEKGEQALELITTIDAFRLLAARTGRYAGHEVPMWAGRDGQWTDSYFADELPAGAKFGVRVAGQDAPRWRIAYWDEYAPYTIGAGGERVLAEFWQKMPRLMLSKVAEALALRSAFPEELAGLYTTEEFARPAAPGRELADGPAPSLSKGPTLELDPQMDRSGDDETFVSVDSATPGSRLQLERALVELGIASERDRGRVIADFRQRYAAVAEQNPIRFYALIFNAVRRDPRLYGATLEPAI